MLFLIFFPTTSNFAIYPQTPTNCQKSKSLLIIKNQKFEIFSLFYEAYSRFNLVEILFHRIQITCGVKRWYLQIFELLYERQYFIFLLQIARVRCHGWLCSCYLTVINVRVYIDIYRIKKFIRIHIQIMMYLLSKLKHRSSSILQQYNTKQIQNFLRLVKLP